MESGQQQDGIRKRKHLSGEQRYQILEEVKRSPGKKGEILRREGLYTNDVQRYAEVAREASIRALSQMRPGKKKIREVPLEVFEAMKREHDKKEKALAEFTVEFMALKKKVNGE
ncbi:MAG: hypothetical protein A2268_05165 [Candidatus Raymondbacteria bacterium RifOxyA12_full_50_37]|uniref:Transposase n=1 Tax=Candidatus Raymondbacteria bacterium RIFOXYD12_FULL_49_13 TaxID=1817890 RepID=A0A1F7FDW4_UNCRA|nr:MAG: hypothetical protein A2248_10095 [Candidatus Raymondbacteria bacterium RIFOXYA2_FULL_49_16]OGJ88155.1 MAG: hypothetical protein A2268_05165 [Candidatus Raymondbacteria bacterium RifOxyA12_full_50_37]OGJ93634.1 MAG: hypothetical protein A2350_06590 [Candidatus Raymondbacteria bacterium RifOxyB12_full_50_8]OGJ96957.1 MAG: hypothetical protein A2453_04970 [Candidatus Raymondbacteria bacterium RIFOXYC2_FULL_50_21]OGK04682.1 MAG: hypothetical protein A2519_21140 [Candidatus Raymondbacteria b